jgi:hypothetical protein
VDLVRDRMKSDKIYDEFLKITEVSALQRAWKSVSDRQQREHVRVFGHDLEGEDIEFCLPKNKVPDTGLKDFTSCQK